MDVFQSSIKDDLNKPYIINPDPINIIELSFEQQLSYVNSAIYDVYNPDQTSIEEMFIINSTFPLSKILDLMNELLQSEKFTIEDIKKIHYPEFTCHVLFMQKEIQDIKIICKAIQNFIYLFYIDNEIIGLFDYVAYYLFSDDCESNINVIATSIPLLGYLYTSNIEHASIIISNEKIMNQIFSIAKNTNTSLIQCSHALKLICAMVYCMIHYDDYKRIQPQFFEPVLIKSLLYLKSSIRYVTDETLKLFQVITTDLDFLNIAKKNGLERIIMEDSLRNLNDSQIPSLYKIIRNILYFTREGKIQTKIINFANFFTKTSDLIKSNVDEKTLDIIISTINILGIGFWEDLLRLGVCGSLLYIMRDNNYSIQKRICSILLSFFKDADAKFRRCYCNEEIVGKFIEMLDDEDDEFCIELIINLSLILSSDPDFFRPMFEQFEYDQHLEDLAQNENQQLAELAQVNLNDFNN